MKHQIDPVCRPPTRCEKLLSDIEQFLSVNPLGESYFGKVSCGNSELIARLRNGGRVHDETEEKIRRWMAEKSPEVVAL